MRIFLHHNPCTPLNLFLEMLLLFFHRDDEGREDQDGESPDWDLGTVKGPGILRLQQDEDRKRVQNGEPPMHEVRRMLLGCGVENLITVA